MVQRLGGYLGVVEWMADAVDFLIRLVALASHEHTVAFARLLHRARDGGVAIALDDDLLRPLEARKNVGDDRIAILAARIVVGDDDHVGVALSDRCHLRTLAAVAFPAAAEDADQSAANMR